MLLTGLFGVQRTAAQTTYNDDGTKLIWSTTMTVGTMTVGTPTSTVDAVYQEVAGYESGSHGSLGSTEFAYGGASYSVSRLSVIKETLTASGFVFNDALRFKLAVLFPVASDGRLVLELGTARFALSDANRRGEYIWKNHGLNWDENDSVEVKLSELQPPSAPRDLTADTKSPAQVDLAWDAPAASGGSDATGYRIEVSTDAGSTWSVLVADTNSTDTTYTDSSPTNSCSLRTYRVSAINVIGTGLVSDTVLAAVPRAGNSPEVAIIPSGHSALWSSTLTVGWDGYKLGYNADETYGTLSDDSFDYRGSTYTIDRLHGDPTVFSLGVGSGDLTAITSWTLLVGGKAFESTDGTAVGTTGRSWDAPAARPMCPGETVTVKLTTRRHAPERESPEGGKLWSAIMTTGQFDLGTGYDAEGLTVAGALSNDEFVYDGTTYYVTSVSRLHDGRLWVQLTDGSCCPPMLPPRTGIIVDGEPFAFADATSFDTVFIWPNVRNWGVGKQVVVKIVSDINSPEHFPELLVQNAEVAESGTPGTTSTMTFHVAVDAAPDFPVGVHYETEDVTATGGTSCAGSSPPDYISTEGRLTFGPDESSKDVEVTVCDDTVMDSGETFRLVLRSTQLHEPISALGMIGPEGKSYKDENGEDEETAHASGTITNDEATTEVSIAADAAYVKEGAVAAFTLRRTGGEADEALTVPVSVVEDGAEPGTAAVTNVTFEAGSGKVSLRAPTDDDGAAEADTTVTATVQAGDAWQLAEGAASASVTVLDNDAAAVTSTSTADVTVWSADMTVVEYGTGAIGAGTADLLANQSGSARLTAKWLWYDPAARALKIAFDAGLDDAESMTLHVGGVSVRFPAGRGGDSSFTLADVDVSWSDGATLSARISKPSATSVSTDATLASLTVPGARLSPAFDAGVLVYRAAVDAGVGTVTVQASATDGGATVSYGPAEDADGALSDHQVAVPAGETLATVTVTAADGRTARAYRVVVVRPTTVSVSFGAASYTATEGGAAASVTVELDTDPKREVTIALTATREGGAAAEDYTAPGSVTFVSGGALSQAVVVSAVADEAAESGESVVLGFGALPDGVEAGATARAAVTLSDAAVETANTAPTGLPAITGTPDVGEVLTASVSDIADGDGLENATFAWQWLATDGTEDTEIEGATGATHEVAAEDAGKTLKVRATFTDDKGNEETLMSGATEAVVDRRPVASTLSVGEGAAEAGRFRLRVAFGDAVTGLALADLSAARVGGDAAAVTDLTEAETGRAWTAWVAAEAGRYTVRLAAGAAGSGERRSLASVLAVDVDADGNATAVAGPVVTAVALATASDGTWTAGETVRLSLTFSEPVTVSTDGGTPTVGIGLDGSARRAAYAGGTGRLAVFSWTLTAHDGTVSAASLTADSLAMNGGTIRDAASRDADLEHPGLGEATEETESAPALTGLKLVNTASGTETALADGDALVLDDPANGSWGLVASVAPEAQVGSVRLVLTGGNTGLVATDDAAPFSLHGDEDGTVAGAGLPAGSYTLKATAYAEAAGAGAELGTLSVSFTVAASEAVAPDALTASFEGVPEAHGGPGSEAFTFRVRFSQEPRVSYAVLRDESFAVAGGGVRRARRVDGRNDLREIHVEPEGWDDVRVTLAGGRACGTEGAICTADGKVLANTAVATVPGPLALSVADAEAREGPGVTLDFEVTLNRAASATVTVDYATADGTATAGADYTAASGTLTFAPGETAKTVNVPVLDDAHDDTGETLTLTLSNASGARIRDGEATGTIENSDAIPKAWLARFGRTVADHVVDAVAARLTGSSGGGSQVTLGGQPIPLDGSAGGAAPGGARERGSGDARFADGWTREGASATERSLTGRELLLGSSFVLNLSGDGEDGAGAPGTRWTAWGRASSSRFDGEADGLVLDGDVTTFTLGADAAWDRWLAGVAVALSEGEGGFRDHDDTGDANHPDRGSGALESTLTSAHPYARLEVSERLSLWGLLGYGTGELDVEVEGGGRWSTETTQEMAAAGARGVLVKAPETGGFELGLRGDAVVQRMRSESATGEAGNLAAAHAQTSRVRLVLEGARRFEVGDGGVLTPTLEAGLRQDGGDAETGTGIELGGGLAWADPVRGLTVEAKARTLIAHEDADYREWGASGSVRIEPGASGRGLSLTLAPAWGAAEGGAERLWSLRDARGLAPDAEAPGGSRLEAELGYGFAVFGERGVATPYAGLSRSQTGETLRLGQSLRMGASQWKVESAFGEAERAWGVGYGYRLGQALDLSVEATRREAANDDAPEHGVMLRLGARW